MKKSASKVVDEYEVKRALEEVGLQIERALRERKMTTRELATAANLDPLYLDDIIKGKAEDVEIRTLADLGFALGFHWNVLPLQKRVTKT